MPPNTRPQDTRSFHRGDNSTQAALHLDDTVPAAQLHDAQLTLPAGFVARPLARQITRAVPHAQMNRDGQITVPLDRPLTAAALADWLLPHPHLVAALPTPAVDTLHRELARLAAAVNDSVATTIPDHVADTLRSRMPPPAAAAAHPYQLAAIHYIDTVAQGRALLADDAGAGKTLIAASTLHLRDAWPAIIIGQATLKPNLEDELVRWVGTHLRVHTVEGQTSRPLPDADAYIVNFELLHHRLDDLLATNPRAVIVDESQNLKSPGPNPDAARRWVQLTAEQRRGQDRPPGSLRTWATTEIAHQPNIRAVLLLSATPAPNGRHAELAPQITVIGRIDELGGHQKYLARYTRHCPPCAREHATRCTHNPKPKRYGRPNTKGSINADELQRRLRATMMVRRTQRQFNPGLDPIRHITVRLELSDRELASYRHAETELIDYLREHAAAKARAEGIPVGQAVARALAAARGDYAHLVQLTHLRREVALAKLPHVQRWIDERTAPPIGTTHPRKAIIYAWHRDVQHALADTYPDAPRIFSADETTADEIRAATHRFQNDPTCPIIICSIGAASEGHTLDQAELTVVVEPPFQGAALRQIAGRSHGRASRPDHAAVLHTPVVVGTVDEDILATVDVKRALMQATTDLGAQPEWATETTDADNTETDTVTTIATAILNRHHPLDNPAPTPLR